MRDFGGLRRVEKTRVSDLSSWSYSDQERGELPDEAVGASLGCGNPVALAALSDASRYRGMRDPVADAQVAFRLLTGA